MSRKNELLKLANVFHSQAKRAQTHTVKWALWKMGDEYQREAERLRGQSSESQMRRKPKKLGTGGEARAAI